jgi:DNA replication protein DnaC
MTKQEKWEEHILPRVREAFSPRLRDDLIQIPTKSSVIELEDDPQMSYYIYGPVGSGKTLLAAQIVVELKRRAFLSGKDLPEATLITIPELLFEIQSFFGKNSADLVAFMNGIAEVDLLVLDDLGSEKSTDWAFQILYMIINRRYEQKKPIILTSNLSLDQLSETLGDDRIPSRLKQMCRILFLNNKDFRNKR